MPSLLSTVALGTTGVLVSAVVATQVFGTGPVEAVASGSLEAEVVKIVDGDTIDVRYGDGIHRVRLLNVDAPESKDPNRPVECLGVAASEFLAEQLPLDTTVTLEFDEDLHDPYDRLLAGVVKGDVLVNAEIARAGLGVPVYYEPNDRFLSQVQSAHAEAKSEHLGLYDPDAECSIPAQIVQLQAAQQQVQAEPAQGATAAVIAAYVSDVETHRGQAAALLLLLDGDTSVAPLAGYSAQELADMRSRIEPLEAAWKAVQEKWETEHEQAVVREKELKAEEERKAAEEEAARKAEEERKAAEEEAARQAEEERKAAEEEAARQAEEDRRRAAEERERDKPPAPAPSPPKANPGAGYTGCRAYIGGPYIDDKGRHYTPIDCETKLPLLP